MEEVVGTASVAPVAIASDRDDVVKEAAEEANAFSVGVTRETGDEGDVRVLGS